jgi:hypothetical protein
MEFNLKSKIIFLDMDGVINCSDHRKLSLLNPDLHCPELVGVVNGLAEIPDIKIVVSSVWRMGETIESMNAIFNTLGIKLECVGLTPTGGYCRGEEIEKWIKANIGNDYWKYKRYAIIDDDSDMLYNQRFNFFHVDHHSGITTNTVYKIKNFFEGME